MKLEFDPDKNRSNIEKRGLSFHLAKRFDFDTAIIKEDRRHEYEEVRYQALGMIGQRLHFLAFTLRGDSLRVISLRKANCREVHFYEQETQP